jgi:hypothetical protein
MDSAPSHSRQEDRGRVVISFQPDSVTNVRRELSPYLILHHDSGSSSRLVRSILEADEFEHPWRRRACTVHTNWIHSMSIPRMWRDYAIFFARIRSANMSTKVLDAASVNSLWPASVPRKKVRIVTVKLSGLDPD